MQPPTRASAQVPRRSSASPFPQSLERQPEPGVGRAPCRSPIAFAKPAPRQRNPCLPAPDLHAVRQFSLGGSDPRLRHPVRSLARQHLSAPPPPHPETPPGPPPAAL